MTRDGAEELDERFTAFVRSRGEYHLRMATLLTGNPAAAEDLMQASLVPTYSTRDPCPARSGPAPRYKFTISHPAGTRRLVDYLTCTVPIDSQGNIRSLAQTTAFAAGGQGGAAEGTIYTADFTFSDFGIRFSVTPPPASQTDPDIGVAVQF